MTYIKGTLDYQLNIEAFHDVDDHVPMTKPERDALRQWAKSGHDIDENPWNLIDEHGYPINYLQAYRIKIGYSSGPWDYWKGSEDFCNKDMATKSFFTVDDYTLM